MREEIIKYVMTGLTAILTGIAGVLGRELLSYLKTKKQAVIKQIGANEYNSLLTIAHAVAPQVEQMFKGLSGVGTEKAQEFDKQMIKLVPGLSEDMLQHLRESVVGEMNKDIKSSGILEDTPYVEAEQDEPVETVTVVPVYVAPDGTKLQPIQ